MTSSTWIKSIGFFLWLLAWPAMMNHQAAAQSGGIDLADMPPVPALPQVTPNHLLADQLVILAQQVAHGSTQPTPAQMQAMQMMLDQALILEQGDPELWRMQIELTRRSNNPEKHMAALQSYLALVPSDDAAQMDLILLHLQKAQTVEARLNGLNRLLDAPTTQSFSPALRSRLASLAAAAAQELGDKVTFQSRLRQATQLDPSNKQAMEMITGMLRTRSAGNLEHGVAIIGLINADPLNAQHRRTLADLLVEQGIYDQAAQQYAAAQLLSTSVWDELFYRAWVTALSISGRHTQALQVLSDLEQMLQAAQAGSAAAAADGTSEPMYFKLPASIELLRYAIHVALGEREPRDRSLDRLKGWTKITPDANKPELVRLNELEYAWLQVALGPMEEVDKVLAAIPVDESAADKLIMARIRGYALMRQGQTAQARALLEPLAQDDPAAALAMAMLEDGGVKGSRAQALSQILTKVPVGLVAMLAAQELQSQRLPLPITEGGLALGRQLRQMPRAIREPDFATQPLVQMSVKPTKADYNYLEPVTIQITLRNMIDLPLAFEPEGPLPTRLVLRLQPQVMGRVVQDVAPVVVDLRRGLVLRARETMTLTARLDLSEFGNILTLTPTDRVSFSGLAALDVKVMAQDRVQVGLLGMTEVIQSLERYGLGLTLRSLDVWLNAMEDPSPVAQMRAAAWLLTVYPRLGGGAETKEIANRIQDTLIKHYDQGSVALQTWMARCLQSDMRGNRTLQPLHDRITRGSESLTQIVYLTGQISDPNAPPIDAAIKGKDPLVAEFAGLLRVVLEERAKLKATEAVQQP